MTTEAPETPTKSRPPLREGHVTSHWQWRAFYLRARLQAYSVVPFRWLFGRLGSEGFGVITYHRITPRVQGEANPPCNVTPARFRRQLEGLLRQGYEPWPLTRCIESHDSGRPVPRNVFVVAFDDGYENNYTHAFPILKALQVPATVFVATAYLDSPDPLPFDDWDRAGDPNVPANFWRALSTPQCRAMLESGLIELGSHTHRHEDFRGRVSDFCDDLQESLQLLRSRFGLERPSFSFPFGHLDSELIAAARSLGVACCLTCENDVLTLGSDPHRWGRFGSDEFDNAWTLGAKLDGWYSAARSWWRRLRGRLGSSAVRGPV